MYIFDAVGTKSKLWDVPPHEYLVITDNEWTFQWKRNNMLIFTLSRLLGITSYIFLVIGPTPFWNFHELYCMEESEREFHEELKISDLFGGCDLSGDQRQKAEFSNDFDSFGKFEENVLFLHGSHELFLHWVQKKTFVLGQRFHMSDGAFKN